MLLQDFFRSHIITKAVKAPFFNFYNYYKNELIHFYKIYEAKTESKFLVRVRGAKNKPLIYGPQIGAAKRGETAKRHKSRKKIL